MLLVSAVIRSTLTPCPTSISYWVTVGPREKPVTGASTWNCFEHARDRAHHLVVGRRARLRRGAGGERGCRRAAGRARSAAAERGGAASSSKSARPVEPGSRAAGRRGRRPESSPEAGGPAVDLAGEALHRILGPHEFLEQLDADAVASAALSGLGARPSRPRQESPALSKAGSSSRWTCCAATTAGAWRRRSRPSMLPEPTSSFRPRAPGLRQLRAEQVGVELAQARADAVRRRLGDDEEGEHQQQDDGGRAPKGVISSEERCAIIQPRMPPGGGEGCCHPPGRAGRRKRGRGRSR